VWEFLRVNGYYEVNREDVTRHQGLWCKSTY
jgi:hypothetical protein